MSRAAPQLPSGSKILAERNRKGDQLTSRRIETAPRIVPFYFMLGIAGLFLAFGNISSFLDYFQDPAKYIDLFAVAAHTLAGVASLLLRPFLGFALVMLWCGWLDRSGQSAPDRNSAVVMAFITLVGDVGSDSKLRDIQL